MTEYYDCYYPYMITEMEDVALANAADCFDMRFRMIALRTVVNMDVFLEGDWIYLNLPCRTCSIQAVL